MKVLGRIFAGLALLTATFLAVGTVLPGRWESDVTGSVPAAPDSVHATLSRASSWPEWMPWPESGAVVRGPSFGPGSTARWSDPTYGSGRFTIVESVPERAVGYRVEVEGGSIRIEGRLTLEAAEEGTRVRWVERGSLGWNPLLGYAAIGMGERQEAQLLEALERLGEVVGSGRSAR